MAKKRGFASMDPAKQREIASKGGRSARTQGQQAPPAPQSTNPMPPPLPNGNASPDQQAPEQSSAQAPASMPVI